MSTANLSSVDLQQHIYNSLLESRTADITLHVKGTWEAIYKLHRVVLIQAGFFNSLFTAGFLESSPKPCDCTSGQQDIDIVFDDRNITRAAFEVCLSRLYGGGPPLHVCPSLVPTRMQPLTPSFSCSIPTTELPNGHHPATPSFLMSLLATAVYLSIPSVASQALTGILSTTGPYTVAQYLSFATGVPIDESHVADENQPEAAVGLEKIATLINHNDLSILTSRGGDNGEARDILADKLHELTFRKEDPADSDVESESDAPPKCTPCFGYGTLSDKIGETAVCWLARWGPDVFVCEDRASPGRDAMTTPIALTPSAPKGRTSSQPEDALPYVPPRVPVIWARGGLTSKWIRELMSSDALFVKGERERYDLARGVVELRRRQGIDEEEEKDWEIMFREGIYYTNLLVEDILAISQDISPTTRRPFVPIAVLQAVHWNQSLLRYHITSNPTSLAPPHLSPPPRDKELGVCLTTAEILSRVSASDQQSIASDEKEKIYYSVSQDTSIRIGDNSGVDGATMEQLFEPSALSANKTLPRVATTEANVFGLKPDRKTALECIASDSTGKVRWSPFPPLRFAVEFWDITSLKEKNRLHSQTIWYAGSLFNVYIQVVRKKGVQLGIYLHRQSTVDPIPGASAPVQACRGHDRNRALSLPQPVSSSPSQPVVHYSPSIHPLSRSTSPDSSPSSLHSPSSAYHSTGHSLPATAQPVAPVQPYRDPRPSVSAYFTVSCANPTGSSITRFTSAPDVFSVNQSWGWKSSALRADELGEGDADGRPRASGPAPREVSLRATIVLGIV